MKMKFKRTDQVIKFFADTGVSVSWNDLYTESANWGAWICKNNIKKLGIRMGNCPEFLYAFFGALRVGTTVVLIPTTGDLDLPDCTVVTDEKNHYTSLEKDILVTDIKLSAAPITEYDWSLDDTVIIAPTSGTSGYRKWLEKSIRNYFSPSLITLCRCASLLRLNMFNCSPWFHNTGIYMLLLLFLGVNFTEITMASFNPIKAKSALIDLHPNLWMGTPSMLYRSCIVDSRTGYVPALTILSGEAIRLQYIRTFSQCDGFRILLGTYGTTEVGSIGSFIVEGAEKSWFSRTMRFLMLTTGTVHKVYQASEIKDYFAGDMLDSVNVKIEDANKDGIGRVLVKTKTMAKGHNNCYYDTGDLGYTSGRSIFITGRSTGLINHSGEKIIPQDIESLIMRIPSVKSVAAFGIPSESHGEGICIAVEGTLTNEQAQLVLPKYMWPDRIMELDNLPLNASGKTDILKLKEITDQNL